MSIECDSGRNVNILRDASSDHYERKFIRTCIYFLMVTETELFKSKKKKYILNGNKKDKLFTVKFI